MIVFSRWKQSCIKSAMVRFIVFADRPYASWDMDGGVFGGKDNLQVRDAYIMAALPDAILCKTDDEEEKIMLLL